MSDLTDLTIADAVAGLKQGDFSSVELTEAHLRQMERARGLNVFVTETPDRALEAARAADHRRSAGEGVGEMDGIPYVAKDLFCTKGVLTTAGSHILENFVPPYESTVTANLAEGGAVLLGKANMDEFAMGSSNVTSYFGSVKNPWRAGRGEKAGKDLVPGGSSGGSAAAVAARMCMGALGTDTGGSIRQPASFCGIVGMKPTYGRCSRWGIVAFASSLDQAGTLTRTVRDSAIMLAVMAGHDGKDTTSAPRDVPRFHESLTGDLKGMKIGIPKEYRLDDMPEEIEALWTKGADWLKHAGAELVDVSLPHTKYALPVYHVVAPAEASSNLARYDGVRYGLRVPGDTVDEMYMRTRQQGFGEEVKRRVMIGTYVLSAGYYDAYYLKAQKVRTRIKNDFDRVFQEVEALLTPTAPFAAFAIGEKMDDPIAMYLNDVFAVPSSLAGLPAISVPVGLDGDGLPLGLQVVGRPFDEQTVFNVAQGLEDGAKFVAAPAREDFLEAENALETGG